MSSIPRHNSERSDCGLDGVIGYFRYTDFTQVRLEKRRKVQTPAVGSPAALWRHTAEPENEQMILFQIFHPKNRDQIEREAEN